MKEKSKKSIDKEQLFVYYINCNKNKRSKEAIYMKIVNLPRFIISMIIIVCILSFITSMLTTRVFSAAPIQYDSIVVSEGDTLWSIANNIGGNVNKNIYEIKEINNLENSIIYVGQELKIPTQI